MLVVAVAVGATMAPGAGAAQGTVTAHKKYGYPYPNAPDCYEGGPHGHGRACGNSDLDKWSFYKGQCTSWVAFRLNRRNHVSFTNWYMGQHFGDARIWGEAANGAKITVDDKPAIGAVAWYSFGHVGYVEKVSPQVVISEMNYDNRNGFRVRTISRGNYWPTGFIHIKDLKGHDPSEDNPVGHLDKVGSPAAGKVRVAGWAYDPNAKTKPVAIHAYIGGKAGAKGAKRYKLGPATKKRGDVAKKFKAKGVGSRHGFDKVIDTKATGPQPVCVYAINRGPGSSTLLACKKVDIKVEYEPCSTALGDGIGTFWPWDQTWHLRNCLNAGPSNYIFRRGKNKDVIPVVGDWNGDGKDTIGLYWPWDRTWHLRDTLTTGSTDYGFQRGKNSTIIPVVGDWDGDGKDSTGAFWPWDGTWHLRNSLSAGPSDYGFKRAKAGREDEVIPVVGDWDGDGRDSTGVFWPWDGTWHLRNSLSAGPSDYIFKRAKAGREDEVIPVVGDWDGDGRDSTGVYWPWDGTWHLRNSLSAGPSDYIFKRGRKDKIPVVGDWDGEGKVAPEPPAAPEPEPEPAPTPEEIEIGPAAHHVRRCVVPRVRGNRVRVAVRKIRSRHCTPKILRRAVRNRRRIGRVLQQTPRPASKRRAGAEVRLLVGASRRSRR